MVRVPTDIIAGERARWLAELSEALEEAQRVLWQLGPASLRDMDALDLSARLEAARAEARSLRISRTAKTAGDHPPEWTNLLWNRRSEGDA